MFTFVSGNLALDFAGSVHSRRTEFLDLLSAPADLADWTVAANLLTDAPSCDDDTLDRGVQLREAIYRLALAAARGEPGAPGDRELVNELAAGELPSVTLRSDASVQRVGTADDALAAIARAAVELLGGPDRPRIKECARSDCTRLYLDTSRAGSRRWCDMKKCGNRAKSASFRARHT